MTKKFNIFQLKERYKRNIAINSVGIEGQENLLKSRILVAGAGGLGSGVISSFVSAGIGTLGIIDYDTVAISNLNRQFLYPEDSIGRAKTELAQEWVKKYSPNTKVKTYKLRIDESLFLKKPSDEEILCCASQGLAAQSNVDFFQDYDIVIDCFDSYKSKFALNKICVEKGLPLIHGGVGEFSGQVFTIIPRKTACLNCLFSPSDAEAETSKGILSPTVNLIASIQAMEAIKLILNFDDLLTDTLLTYDGITQDFRKISLQKKKDCSICG